MPQKRKRITLETANCPKCHKKGALKQILWGMPSADVDLDRYIIGGCCLPENPHEIGCVQCDWTGWRGSLMPRQRILEINN